MDSAVLPNVSSRGGTKGEQTHVYGGSICRRRRRSATLGAERAPLCQCLSEALATASVF